MFTGQFVGEPLLIICMYAVFVAQIKNLLNYNLQIRTYAGNK